MTRSRFTPRHQSLNVAGRPRGYRHHVLRHLPLASAISAILAGGVPVAQAQTAPASAKASDTLEEVPVTAQKVTENLQNVPVSIEAIGTQKIEQLNIANLDDYVEYLAGVTTIKSIGQGGNGVGTTHVYMRGINSGQDGNHSGSQPTVGTYFDEQPVTTIDGTVDMHIYDIARIEVLEGPQGTLYGASSEAGTVRIISNKPDPTGFKAGYDLDLNNVDHGGTGYDVEAFVNLPLTSTAAVRLVGWDQHDAGYISNVHGTVTFPTSGAVFDNAALVKKDYNTVETTGGRAALKVELNDSWTIMPTVMGQVQRTDGDFAYNPAVGDLEVQHYFPQYVRDSWV